MHADSWGSFPAKIKSQPHVLQQLGRRQRRGSYMHQWGINNRKLGSYILLFWVLSLAELLCMGIDGMGDFRRLHGDLIDRFIWLFSRISEVSEASVYRLPSGLTLSNRYVKRFLERKTPLGSLHACTTEHTSSSRCIPIPQTKIWLMGLNKWKWTLNENPKLQPRNLQA